MGSTESAPSAKLDEQDIPSLVGIVQAVLVGEARTSAAKKLSLGVPIPELLVFHVLIPILTSICASATYDALTKKRPRSLTMRECEDILRRLEGTSITASASIPQDLRTDIEETLKEYAVGPEAVDKIVNDIRARIGARSEPDDRPA